MSGFRLVTFGVWLLSPTPTPLQVSEGLTHVVCLRQHPDTMLWTGVFCCGHQHGGLLRRAEAHGANPIRVGGSDGSVQYETNGTEQYTITVQK